MIQLTPSILTQGDTGSASTVQLRLSGGRPGPSRVRVRVCNDGGYANATNASIAPSGGCTTLETHSSGKDLTLQSSIAAFAAALLTLTGVVKDTQTFTLGSRVMEFDTHDAATITAGRLRVDISSYATKAQGTLTLALQPSALETMTIGTRTYVWVASGTANAPGEISVGANLAAAKLNAVAAINGTDGFNTANSLVSAAAFSGDDCVLTALAGGTDGDSIVTTENMAGSGNEFDGTTLGTTTAGADCTAANACTAIIAAVNADTVAAGKVAGAAAGGGTTVAFTALTAGADGNSLASTETMANGSFGGAVFSGGADALDGLVQFTVTNATAETVRVRFGPALLTPGLPADYTPTQDVTHA